mmetsp:Transcript_25851/g.63615  ORF Transcript_25851/g.63615 Transcript_25851/m.63615 type:complete len:353 (-) Transcript_25851:38-1096(-)
MGGYIYLLNITRVQRWLSICLCFCLCLPLPLLDDEALGGVEGVGQQHGDGHGAHAAGHGGDLAAHLEGLVEVHVARQPVPRLLGRVRDRVGADVDDGGAALDPALLDHVRGARGGDDDVGLAADLLGVGGAAVHHGNGAVLLHQHQRGRHAHDVAAPHHHGVLALELHAAALQQHDAALGRARHEQRLVALHAQRADVQRVEPVHVLAQADGAQDLLLVHVLGQRQLHQDAVARWVRVEVAHHLEHLLLRGALRHLVVERHDAGLVARLALHAHVRLAVRPAAHDHHRQPRHLPVLLLHGGNLRRYLQPDRAGDRLAIDDLRRVVLALLAGAPAHGACWLRCLECAAAVVCA